MAPSNMETAHLFWVQHEHLFAVNGNLIMRFENHSFPSRRVPVAARHGLVATNQPLAVQAGLAFCGIRAAP